MRYLLLGDTHNDVDAMVEAMQVAETEGCDRIFQLGDFGYFFRGDENLFAVSEIAQTFGIPVDFLDGNHENFDILREGFGASPDDEFPSEIVPFVTYYPRGYVWKEGEVRMGTFGGAVSIDKSRRVKYQSWWPEESITEEQVTRTLKVDGRVDIMLTHDVPSLGRTLENMLHSFDLPYKLDEETKRNRELLHQVYRAWSPKIAFHGHYHYWYCERNVYGLNMNGEEGNYVTLDTENYTVS